MPDKFRSTRWTIISDCRSFDSMRAKKAMEEICQTYWKPVFGFFYVKSGCAEQAKDLTQGFFESAIENNFFQSANRKRGNLRNYLMRAVRNFLIKDFRKNNAQKRGGEYKFISIEKLGDLEGESQATPEEIFDRQWGQNILSEALKSLGHSMSNKGKKELFFHLRPLMVESPESKEISEIAGKLNITANHLKVSLHRMKIKFREFVRHEVSSTLGEGDDIEHELLYLTRVLNNIETKGNSS